jgi:hypothetical protein
MLRGEPVQVELRYTDDDGQIHSERQNLIITSAAVTGRRATGPGLRQGRGREVRGVGPAAGGPAVGSPGSVDSLGAPPGRAGRRVDDRRGASDRGPTPALPATREFAPAGDDGGMSADAYGVGNGGGRNGGGRTIRVYAYGVARNRLYQAAKHLGVKLVVAETLEEADVLVTLKSYYRKRRRLVNDAEQHNVSVYVLRANTVSQMERFLVEALGLEAPASADPFESAIAETEQAIAAVQSGQASADLRPVGAAIRRYQHEMVRQANLVSHSYGREPYRHVRVFNTARNE